MSLIETALLLVGLLLIFGAVFAAGYLVGHINGVMDMSRFNKHK